MEEKREFYDQGWNDRMDGRKLIVPCTRDYRDGWKDCDELTEVKRKECGKI